MRQSEDFRVLCVTPSLDGKMQFKQTASRIKDITALSLADSLLEAEQKLRAGIVCQSIYVSSYFQIEVIKEFSSSARFTEAGKTASYMLMLQDEDEMQSKDAFKTANLGFDGILECPYSRWSLSKSIQAAKKIHHDRVERIKHAEVEIMVGKLLGAVDRAAHQNNPAPSTEYGKVKKIIGTIHNYSEELKEEYFETLEKKSQDARPKTEPSVQNQIVTPRIIKKRG